MRADRKDRGGAFSPLSRTATPGDRERVRTGKAEETFSSPSHTVALGDRERARAEKIEEVLSLLPLRTAVLGDRKCARIEKIEEALSPPLCALRSPGMKRAPCHGGQRPLRGRGGPAFGRAAAGVEKAALQVAGGGPPPQRSFRGVARDPLAALDFCGMGLPPLCSPLRGGKRERPCPVKREEHISWKRSPAAIP